MRLAIPAVLFVAATIPAQFPLIWPGESVSTIDAEHLRAYVPAEHAEDLRGLVARADWIYAQMCRDAGFEPTQKLRLLISDWRDNHNGFSFVVPFPLVQVELAPALQRSAIFNGFEETERTLIHEFAHQISNDRNSGFRGVLEGIFGRILPNDLLSFMLWYVSTPAHQTMPRFWHEGLATWAETAYADPDSAWGGRGRDPLVHMVWRLDAAAGVTPPVGDWRVTHHEWPFGSRVYTYGVAYARYLSAQFSDRASIWEIIDGQARSWPFVFNRGTKRLLERGHVEAIDEARAELVVEQWQALEEIRGVSVTELERLTPVDSVLGAPAWTPDGSLVFAMRQAQGRPRMHYLRPDGSLDSTWTPTRAMSDVRTTPGGDLVYHEFNWREISRLEVAGDTVGWRMLQPDAVETSDGGLLVAALQLRGGGDHELVVHRFDDGDLLDERVVDTQGRPWSPTLRRGREESRELAWVETDADGSRLVLSSVDDPSTRRVLVSVRGRIIHPVWTADGQHLFYCSDHTGVANAYRLSLASDGEATVLPVTNTVGGVVACVPSPDGETLAIVDHDHRGPFLAKMSADPSTWVTEVPEIQLTWPLAQSRLAAPAFDPMPQNPGRELRVEPYDGLGEIRPLYWAPTSFAVPDGGTGVYGLAADPLFTHVLQAGAGVGLEEHEPVGYLSYDYLGLPIEFGVRGGHSERTFGDAVVEAVTLEEFDYTETVGHGEIRLGRGLFALERTLLLHGGIGIEDHDSVSESTREFAGLTLVNTPFFTGTERYVEATLGYADTTFYPTSYTFEDGLSVVGVYRHSGLDGDLERNLAFGNASYVFSFLPESGHQIALGGQVGWSDGDRTLQSNFSIGGGMSRGLPRGYIGTAQATGRHLLAGSFGYRFPVWQLFEGYSTTPFRSRQLVVELFGDTAKVSDDELDGAGDWYSSTGIEIHGNLEFFDGILSPGIGIAYQLDGERHVEVYFTFAFGTL